MSVDSFKALLRMHDHWPSCLMLPEVGSAVTAMRGKRKAPFFLRRQCQHPHRQESEVVFSAGRQSA